MTHKIPMYFRFTKSARKHRIGRARARYVVDTTEPTIAPHPEGEELSWIGKDDRGLELEIVGINTGEQVIIIHVMPTQYRKRGENA